MLVTGDSIGLVGVTECDGGGGVILLRCHSAVCKFRKHVTVRQRGAGIVYQYFCFNAPQF